VRKAYRRQGSLTVGIDLGDKQSCYCVLDGRGEVIQEGSVGTSKKALAMEFGSMGCCRIALEVGTHSPCVRRILSALGHEVFGHCASCLGSKQQVQSTGYLEFSLS
jgi:hypothetical protein